MQNSNYGPKPPIIDINDGSLIFPTSGNMGIDTDGDLNLRLGDNLSMNMDTGEVHLTFGWDDDDF